MAGMSMTSMAWLSSLGTVANVLISLSPESAMVDYHAVFSSRERRACRQHRLGSSKHRQKDGNTRTRGLDCHRVVTDPSPAEAFTETCRGLHDSIAPDRLSSAERIIFAEPATCPFRCCQAGVLGRAPPVWSGTRSLVISERRRRLYRPLHARPMEWMGDWRGRAVQPRRNARSRSVLPRCAATSPRPGSAIC
jgi:hypothetical protein